MTEKKIIIVCAFVLAITALVIGYDFDAIVRMLSALLLG